MAVGLAERVFGVLGRRGLGQKGLPDAGCPLRLRRAPLPAQPATGLRGCSRIKHLVELPGLRQSGLREVGTSREARPGIRCGLDQVELGVNLVTGFPKTYLQPARTLMGGQPLQQQAVQLGSLGLHGAQEVRGMGVVGLRQGCPCAGCPADQEQQFAVGIQEIQPIGQPFQSSLGDVTDADRNSVCTCSFMTHEAVDRGRSGVVHEGDRSLGLIVGRHRRSSWCSPIRDAVRSTASQIVLKSPK